MSDIAAAVRQRIEREGVTNDAQAEEQFLSLAKQWVDITTRDHPELSEETLLRIGEADELLRHRAGEIWSALLTRTLIRFFWQELEQRAQSETLDVENLSDILPGRKQGRPD